MEVAPERRDSVPLVRRIFNSRWPGGMSRVGSHGRYLENPEFKATAIGLVRYGAMQGGWQPRRWEFPIVGVLSPRLRKKPIRELGIQSHRVFRSDGPAPVIQVRVGGQGRPEQWSNLLDQDASILASVVDADASALSRCTGVRDGSCG